MIHKGFVLAGTHSGCGKTTITMAILRALKLKGLDIQPWKAGPDYIDPGFHTKAAHRKCRNLDTMILSDAVIKEIYSRQVCDMSVIEGVMGLFDGAGGLDERGSAAHLSKMLHLPVILVIDAKAMARSAGAIALGFSEFDPEVKIAGFIMNRVGSDRHYDMLKESIEERTGLPVLGRLPRNSDYTIPERHLGLVPSWEKDELEITLDHLSEAVEEYIDLDRILSIAEDTSEISDSENQIYKELPENNITLKIALALDEAFHFYYEENLDILRHYGAEIIPFSPLKDQSLPEGVSAIYIGGGYPELHCKTLSENRNLINEIRGLCEKGMPLYGECGGFMYLTKGIIDEKDEFFSMLDLLPGHTRLGKKMRALGYCEATLNMNTILGNSGETARGHVFHWAELEDVPESTKKIMTVVKGDTKIGEGFNYKNVLGSWVHLHFASNPSMASSFINRAENYRRNQL